MQCYQAPRLGGFLFWWKLEFQLLHGFKLFHFVHWFRNSFCFRSQMIFYAVCNFLRFKGKFTLGRLEMAEKPLSSGQNCVKCAKNAKNAILHTLKMALPVSERKKRKHFSREMCPQNLHFTTQNQRLTTRKWFFGHFKSSQCKFPLKS